jgi:hypothetical protein
VKVSNEPRGRKRKTMTITMTVKVRRERERVSGVRGEEAQPKAEAYQICLSAASSRIDDVDDFLR